MLRWRHVKFYYVYPCFHLNDICSFFFFVFFFESNVDVLSNRLLSSFSTFFLSFLYFFFFSFFLLVVTLPFLNTLVFLSCFLLFSSLSETSATISCRESMISNSMVLSNSCRLTSATTKFSTFDSRRSLIATPLKHLISHTTRSVFCDHSLSMVSAGLRPLTWGVTIWHLSPMACSRA